ncbi:RNA polymerase sigma factor [Streptomyces sp. FH025]|uniref:RNA polymerase sigma factor n=1 Tax=Streptomyces sp. FH025 TaxID=2815937 RepID=UPI001A9D6840|nr:sigma factor-like helix-turn-helix DNA-binding protein [Streptomyces sp. FH025]MBO1418023.1 sigma-70 family RNA polymerase sigma factor [Streptomyces sp. FH025]
MLINRDEPPSVGGRRGDRTMNDTSGTTPGGARLTLTFDAFCVTHERAWLGFVRTQVGYRDNGPELVVAATKDHLHRNWPVALRQEIPAAYAWRLLKEHLAAWRAAQSEPVAVQAAAMDAVIDHFRRQARISLESLPERIGLLTAILELPERQHDSVVLKYCLDMDDEEVASYLGTPVATLRSNLRHARRRLAHAIGRPDLAERKEDQ